MKREETQQFNAGPYVSYIWSIADDWLRDVYVPSDYRKVILPMVVLRRLDLVQEPTKAKVLEMKRALRTSRRSKPRRRGCLRRSRSD